MPTTRALDVDGKYYKIEYSASTDHVSFDGYKGTVYQPQPGESAAATSITLTVTDKSNPEITASKTLDYKVKPLDQANVDAELALMEQAKAGYAAAILNGQDAKAVTGNLHAFQKAYLDADGNLAWSYDRSTTDATASGIVPVDLPGYDSMGTQGCARSGPATRPSSPTRTCRSRSLSTIRRSPSPRVCPARSTPAMPSASPTIRPTRSWRTRKSPRPLRLPAPAVS